MLIRTACRAALAVVLAGTALAQSKPGCVPHKQPPSDAEAALSREEYDKALDLYRKMAASDPNESRAGVIRALLAQDKLKDAEDQGQAWVKAEPKNAVAVETLGEVFYREGELGDVDNMVHAARELDPCNARLYLMAALMEGLMANFRAEKEHIELAHRLAPNDVEIRHAWIETLPRERQLEERKVLLKEGDLLSANEKRALEISVARAGKPHTGECKLATPVDKAALRMEEVTDGPYANGEVGLNVSFNGKHRILELDTGASGLTLSKAAAWSSGLVREERSRTGGIGDKGDVKTSIAYAASVKIGNLEFRDCEVEILDKLGALDNDGLIGADIFRQFLVTLDFHAMEVRLDPLPKRPEDKAAAGNAANQPDSVGSGGSEEVWHNRYIAPEMRDWTRVYRNGHDLLLPVRIGDARTRLFIVDTGASSMLISPDAARDVAKVKTDHDEHLYGISGEVDKVYSTGRIKIEFGDMYGTVDTMTSIDTTRMSHDTGVQVSGLLGATVLRRLVTHIDYRDNLIKFDFVPKDSQWVHVH